MAIRGGKNIYLREIEEFLDGHPDIEDVQVIGVPDEKYGQALCACIRMKECTTPFGLPALQDFVRGRLAHCKIPAHPLIVDGFPMTVTGKIRKIQLGEEASAFLGL